MSYDAYLPCPFYFDAQPVFIDLTRDDVLEQLRAVGASAAQMEQVLGIIAKPFFPKPKLTPGQWMEEHCKVDGRKFSNREYPYLPWIANLIANKSVRNINWVACIQVGKTTLVYGIIAWKVVNDPMPLLWIMPTKEQFEKVSANERWPNFYRSCEPLWELRPDDLDQLRVWSQQWKGCTVNLTWAGAQSAERGPPAGTTITDEASRIPRLTGIHGRTAAHSGVDQHIDFGNPTVETAEFWQNFLSGTQHHYLCPDPNGGAELMPLDIFDWPSWQESTDYRKWHFNLHCDPAAFAGDTIDKNLVLTTTYYQDKQGRVVRPAQKSKMLRHGEWVQHNPKATMRDVSIHMNTLYSPTKPWGEVHWEWLMGKHDEEKRGLFLNLMAGLPIRTSVESLGLTNSLDAIKGGYQRGIACLDKSKPYTLVCMIDVQGPTTENQWVLLLQCIDGGGIRIIDWGRPALLDNCEQWALERNADFVFIDGRYRPDSIRETIYRRGSKRWSMYRSMDRMGFKLHEDVYPDPHEGTPNAGLWNYRLLKYNKERWRTMFFEARKGEGTSGLKCPDNYDLFLEHQLLNEHWTEVTDEKTGKKEQVLAHTPARHNAVYGLYADDEHYGKLCEAGMACISWMRSFGAGGIHKPLSTAPASPAPVASAKPGTQRPPVGGVNLYGNR